ncbi:hypothetical protein PT2222_120049 [Paraburkholderia tropica]
MLYNECHPDKKVIERKKETEPTAQKRRFVMLHLLFCITEAIAFSYVLL